MTPYSNWQSLARARPGLNSCPLLLRNQIPFSGKPLAMTRRIWIPAARSRFCCCIRFNIPEVCYCYIIGKYILTLVIHFFLVYVIRYSRLLLYVAFLWYWNDAIVGAVGIHFALKYVDWLYYQFERVEKQRFLAYVKKIRGYILVLLRFISSATIIYYYFFFLL